MAPAKLDFHIGFLNDIPILWTVAVFIVLVGAIYYLVRGRTKAFAPVVAPPGDDPAQPLAGDTGAAAAGGPGAAAAGGAEAATQPDG